MYWASILEEGQGIHREATVIRAPRPNLGKPRRAAAVGHVCSGKAGAARACDAIRCVLCVLASAAVGGHSHGCSHRACRMPNTSVERGGILCNFMVPSPQEQALASAAGQGVLVPQLHAHLPRARPWGLHARAAGRNAAVCSHKGVPSSSGTARAAC